nr:acyltransferase [Marinobacter salinus]
MPVYLLYRTLCYGGNRDGTFQSFSQSLSLVPGKLGIYVRAAFYHLACPETSDDISVGFLTVFSHWNTTISRGVYIGPQCNIGMCRIGENVLIGSGVHILSGGRQHEFGDVHRPIQEQGGQYDKIDIGSDCWIGNQAVVMCATNSKSIVAAGSVVVSPMQSGDIVAGNPARLLRNRFEASQATTPSRESGEWAQ